MAFKWFSKHTKQGLECPDPTPIEVPLGLKRPLTLAEQIARFTRDAAIQNELRQKGIETFEESNDFGPEDDSPIGGPTPYEREFDGEEILPVQTKLDEARSGMVEEFPDAQKQSRLRSKIAAQKAAAQNAKNKAVGETPLQSSPASKPA